MNTMAVSMLGILSFLLSIVILILFVFTYMNSKKNRQMLQEIRQRLDELAQVEKQTVEEFPMEEAENDPSEGIEDVKETIEEQDVSAPENTEAETSTYNTGKSGKIYTKEELELLIKE